jgi:hypothetical protein
MGWPDFRCIAAPRLQISRLNLLRENFAHFLGLVSRFQPLPSSGTTEEKLIQFIRALASRLMIKTHYCIKYKICKREVAKSSKSREPFLCRKNCFSKIVAFSVAI